MITFLAPAGLAGAALLAIPVVLHLFKPRKVRRTPFSSLRWLHLSQQKLARRIKWHQVLLFFLRAAFVTLLVLAAAKPLMSDGADAGAPVERFVVLDVSRSMQYQGPGGATPLDTGRKAAAGILQRTLPGDRATLILAGPNARLLGPLTHNSSPYVKELESVKASAGDADLGAALRAIRPMLARRRPDAKVQVDVVTDNQQNSWRSAAISAFTRGLDAPVQVRVVDVGVSGAQNAWVADARLVRGENSAGGRAIRIQVACIGDAGQSRTLRVSGVPGMADVTRTIKIEPGSPSRVEIDLPQSAGALGGGGGVARVRIEPNDALPDDDEFLLNLDPPPAINVLLVEQEDGQSEELRPAFHLRAALRALTATDARTIDVVSRQPLATTPADVEHADVVFLADVPRLTEAATASLEARVKAGAGAAIFLGPHADLDFYNTRLYRPLLPSDGLLPGRLRSAATAGAHRLAPLSNVDASHPLLAPLLDPAMGDVAGAAFRSWYQMDPVGSGVAASIGEGAPAIIDRQLGLGRVVTLNTTANDAWSDLPRRKSFVPLVDLLLNHLTGGVGSRGSFAVGDPVLLPLPDMAATDTVTVKSPAGTDLTPVLQTIAGRTVMRLDPPAQTGIYRVQAAAKPAFTQSFIVQSGRADSVLAPVDAVTLQKWWEPTPLQILSPDDPTLTGPRDRRPVALWPWLVAAACVVLMAEMFLVHWLCPRMNPGVIESVVPRRGILPSQYKSREAGREAVTTQA